MSGMNELPDDFSGMAELKIMSTDFASGVETVFAIYIKHFLNGTLHREDGPAVFLDGKPHEYWVHGRKLSEEEYGHFLEKKALKEKLHAILICKQKTKRSKI